ncbi:MAG: hypothetical protein VX642_05270 [Bdellovibrionota bacterium]|nr:hypothetical protein [Bdellovibrionota bacterium]
MRHLSLASRFIKTHSNKASGLNGNPQRNYSIKDINNDGIPEILEFSNSVEDEHPGLLNLELNQAFEWITIFKLKDGKFIDKTTYFDFFLSKRRTHYELWLKLIETSSHLSNDSKKLIEENKTFFIKSILKLKKRTERI